MKPRRTGFDRTRPHKTQQIHCPETVGLLRLRRELPPAHSPSIFELEQSYVRSGNDGAHQQYEYTAPTFDFSCRLIYDDAGLMLNYPGIAIRAD